MMMTMGKRLVVLVVAVVMVRVAVRAERSATPDQGKRLPH